MTIVITGPAGTGKSYFSCVLGERDCRNGIKVLYFTMNMLIENLKLVHLEGRETNFAPYLRPTFTPKAQKMR